MQMLNQKKIIKRKYKKSHFLIIGSLLVFFGFLVLSWNYVLIIREAVYSDMMLLISDSITLSEGDVIEDIPEVEELVDNNVSAEGTPPTDIDVSKPPTINYDKYLGVLEIPKISLKRGFYGLDSPYNTIEKNVSVVKGSNMPDVMNGNLILMAHSGDAYISFFAYLYRLSIGNDIYVSYKNVKYHYKIVNIYNVEKDGTVSIVRSYDKNTLTLITCTKDDSTKQTVYIAELV